MVMARFSSFFPTLVVAFCLTFPSAELVLAGSIPTSVVTTRNPAATPSGVPSPPTLLAYDGLAQYFQSSPSEPASSSVTTSTRAQRKNQQDRIEKGKHTRQVVSSTCLDSTANATLISSLFYYGGTSTTVQLCANAKIDLENAIFFYAPNQTLTTQGNPIDATRATLTLVNANITCSVYAAFDGLSGVTVKNVQFDGGAISLGRVPGDLALLEMGGNNVGQRVLNVKAWEPRGWSILHFVEGYISPTTGCSGAIINSNTFERAGRAPSGAQQFRRRDTGTWGPYMWADGISLACKNSQVTNNAITDATDGGIVIFGSPGSTISGNTITSDARQLLGGINMVDYAPYGGTYQNVLVSANTLVAQNSLMKCGICVGGMSWGTDNRTDARTWGGTIQNNIFKATGKSLNTGNGGYFGYGIAVAGHQNAVFKGNNAKAALFKASFPSAHCYTQWFPLPSPQAMIGDKYTTPGVTYQREFLVDRALAFVICLASAFV